MPKNMCCHLIQEMSGLSSSSTRCQGFVFAVLLHINLRLMFWAVIFWFHSIWEQVSLFELWSFFWHSSFKQSFSTDPKVVTHKAGHCSVSAFRDTYLILSHWFDLCSLVAISSSWQTLCISSFLSPWYLQAACSWGRASKPSRVRLGAVRWVCGSVSRAVDNATIFFDISVRWPVSCSLMCLLTLARKP